MWFAALLWWLSEASRWSQSDFLQDSCPQQRQAVRVQVSLTVLLFVQFITSHKQLFVCTVISATVAGPVH